MTTIYKMVATAKRLHIPEPWEICVKNPQNSLLPALRKYGEKKGIPVVIDTTMKGVIGVRTKKPFIWSWSVYEAYMNCPKKYEKTWLKKEFVESGESTHQVWGQDVHRALEKAVGTNQPLPSNMQDLGLQGRIATLRAAPGEKYVELKIGLTADLIPCDFFDPNVWLRMVIDLCIINGKKAIAIDYKTGRRKLTDQLRLTALMIFQHFPEVEEVHTGFMWIGLKGKIDTEVYYRKDRVALWGNFVPILKDLSESHRLDIWPAKRNGLCLKYCPVTSCPYNGRFMPEKV